MGEKIFIYMQELKYDIRISVISIRDKVIGTANAIVAYLLFMFTTEGNLHYVSGLVTIKLS